MDKICANAKVGIMYGMYERFFLLNRNVLPGESAQADFELTPRVEGEKTLSARFTSTELEDVDGYQTILVNPSNEIVPETSM